MGNLYGPIFGIDPPHLAYRYLGKYQAWSLPSTDHLILLLIFFPDGIGTRLGIRPDLSDHYWSKKKRRDEGKVYVFVKGRRNYQSI